MKAGEAERLSKLIQTEETLWNSGLKYIAGVDEVGRGPMAGPVVASAVLFSAEVLPKLIKFSGINDSKKVPEAKRGALSEIIRSEAVSFGIGLVDEAEIDRINILRASLLAMKKAVLSLNTPPSHILIDGPYTISKELPPQTAVIGGDAKCFSIAAASIVAKVFRDKLMAEYHLKFPEYNFKKNKGYGTAEHMAAIKRVGLCPIHRKSFGGKD